ncbi:bifunctional DNA primase/polymerase [Streptomyces sp. NPDC090025]|uniref:bifunctional DNA primase/polymerase n=1 Tax=Streptomyces sp. NPDC090025 TaxID=3365922 RepID=UPI0038323938
MTTWLRDDTSTPYDLFRFLRNPEDTRHQTARVTADGAAWLATASAHPGTALARWEERPAHPAVLPCGTAFDVVNVDPIFGRRMLDKLWAEGPGSGPVAVHRGRMLLFAAPGTAQRLPSLLDWEEWGEAVPRPLCHGVGDAVTVPPLVPAGDDTPAPRWLVAPDTRSPWLPGPEVLLWACVRAVRAASAADVRVSIFPSADPDANVYDVSRRR